MNSSDPDAEQIIKNRAHAIWEAEGRPEGRAAEHWQMALSEYEREKKVPNTEKVVDSPAVIVIPGETPILQKKSSRGASRQAARARNQSAGIAPLI
jgi:hypothetical protein